VQDQGDRSQTQGDRHKGYRGNQFTTIVSIVIIVIIIIAKFFDGAFLLWG